MEFLGTFFIVLAVAITSNPFAIAAMVMAWMYIGGHVSGAHYNPLVSLSMVLVNKLSWRNFGLYVLAQILGGISAFAMNFYLRGVILLPQPSVNATLFKAFIVEVVLSTILALVVLNVVFLDKYKNNPMFGFAIGFTILALAFVGSPISGGLFNPAISLGANIFALIKGMSIVAENLLMYVSGALLGGFLAAYLFKFFTIEHKRFVIIEVIED